MREMRETDEGETNLFNEYAGAIPDHPLFLQGRHTVSHGSVSIYTHSINVAKTAFSLSAKYRGLDRRCVVRAGLLHDFFLYEWHVPGMRYLLHGWRHPVKAAENARAVFGLSDKECSCILTHMWPWTLFHPPRYKEGWLVSLADKIVATRETLRLRRLRRFPKPAGGGGT
ncbi:MAG: HD domain-containing protein [Spirochaetaceae bacterium]|nr:HD domain-containing protein [Spirochaetaceae bacterium]